MTAAALGASLPLETFDGEQVVDLAPGTQAGETVTLKGLGVTHLRGTGRGDIIVHVDVRTPTRLDHHQEDLLRQLATARGEERPTGKVGPADGGLFGKLREAFKPR